MLLMLFLSSSAMIIRDVWIYLCIIPKIYDQKMLRNIDKKLQKVDEQDADEWPGWIVVAYASHTKLCVN